MEREAVVEGQLRLRRRWFVEHLGRDLARLPPDGDRAQVHLRLGALPEERRAQDASRERVLGNAVELPAQANVLERDRLAAPRRGASPRAHERERGDRREGAAEADAEEHRPRNRGVVVAAAAGPEVHVLVVLVELGGVVIDRQEVDAGHPPGSGEGENQREHRQGLRARERARAVQRQVGRFRLDLGRGQLQGVVQRDDARVAQDLALDRQVGEVLDDGLEDRHVVLVHDPLDADVPLEPDEILPPVHRERRLD